jgi:hypothetical protein
MKNGRFGRAADRTIEAFSARSLKLPEEQARLSAPQILCLDAILQGK